MSEHHRQVCISALTGYALTKALRDDAQECAMPERIQLLEQAAHEIESLLMEIRQLKKRNP